MRKSNVFVAGLVGAILCAPAAFAKNNIHEAKCKGGNAKCIEKAIKTCNGDYDVLFSESHQGGLLSDEIPGPVRWYSMTYKCP